MLRRRERLSIYIRVSWRLNTTPCNIRSRPIVQAIEPNELTSTRSIAPSPSQTPYHTALAHTCSSHNLSTTQPKLLKKLPAPGLPIFPFMSHAPATRQPRNNRQHTALVHGGCRVAAQPSVRSPWFRSSFDTAISSLCVICGPCRSLYWIVPTSFL